MSKVVVDQLVNPDDVRIMTVDSDRISNVVHTYLLRPNRKEIQFCSVKIVKCLKGVNHTLIGSQT